MEEEEIKIIIRQALVCIEKGEKEPGICQPLLSGMLKTKINLAAKIGVDKVNAITATDRLLDIAIHPEMHKLADEFEIKTYLNNIAKIIDD